MKLKFNFGLIGKLHKATNSKDAFYVLLELGATSKEDWYILNKLILPFKKVG